MQAGIDRSPRIHGYADALISAIENILRNAVRHSPAGGTVEVQLSCDDTDAKITIRDQGKGVDDADLPRLFEPFYRTRDAADTGTGLGLAIADRAIRLNRGRITAENLKEAGLQVVIKLPMT